MSFNGFIKAGIVAALFSIFGASAESISRNVQDSLKQYRVAQATLDAGVLRIVMRDSLITPTVYETVAQFGVCNEAARDAAQFKTMRLARVEVLNSVEGQGFAFEANEGACEKLVQLPAPAAKAFFDARTVRCEAGVCRRRP